MTVFAKTKRNPTKKNTNPTTENQIQQKKQNQQKNIAGSGKIRHMALEVSKIMI